MAFLPHPKSIHDPDLSLDLDSDAMDFGWPVVYRSVRLSRQLPNAPPAVNDFLDNNLKPSNKKMVSIITTNYTTQLPFGLRQPALVRQRGCYWGCRLVSD